MRGDGRIYKRPGSPFYYYDISCDGKEHRKSTKQTEEAKARKVLREKMKEVGAHQIGARVFIGPQQERVTVNAILDDLISDYKAGGKKQIAREVTAQMKSSIKRLRAHFGAMRAVRVSRRDVTDFISTLRGEGKANATINRFTQLLAQAYKVAVKAEPPVLSRALTVPKQDESGNVRKGKFTEAEAEAVFAGLPEHMADAARFAYEVGIRKGQLFKLKWAYLVEGALSVPAADIKNRKPHNIALTPTLEEILQRRRAKRVEGCDLIFHHDGDRITDYRHCWYTACVMAGLGRFYCRDCKDEGRKFAFALDATKTCPKCGRQWTGRSEPRYIGRIFHDFRRSAAYELWKAKNPIEDCMMVTGHATASMFKRYADLFSDEEKLQRQLATQAKRAEWRADKRKAAEAVAATERVQ